MVPPPPSTKTAPTPAAAKALLPALRTLAAAAPQESADSQLRASASIVRSTQRSLANLLRSQHNDVAPARVDGSRLMENAEAKRKLGLTTLETTKINEATHLLGMTLEG